MQNGIEEPWQRIPSVIAVFAAEASLILLDPSNDHYPTLSKLLMRSSGVNMKVNDEFLALSLLVFKGRLFFYVRVAFML